MGKDKYGNYVNEKGVTIKIGTDKKGNDHVSFYGGEVDGNHSGVHVNLNYDKNSWSSTTHSDDKSEPPDHGSGGCYLTSACLKHLKEKFDDNCEELTTLRWFRDNFVTKEDIKHYYKVAPAIVEAIDRNSHSDDIYNNIYNNVIDVCLNAIKQGNYEFAYDKYRESVLQLEKILIPV